MTLGRERRQGTPQKAPLLIQLRVMWLEMGYWGNGEKGGKCTLWRQYLQGCWFIEWMGMKGEEKDNHSRCLHVRLVLSLHDSEIGNTKKEFGGAKRCKIEASYISDF